MGFESDIKFVSMNVTKAGRVKESYLRKLLDVEQPDLCLLPGDNSDLKKCVVYGYKEYFTQGTNKPVMLYNTDKVKLKWSPVSVNDYQQLPGINFDLISCPEAEVELSTYSGMYKETKHFSVLTWDPSMTRNNSIDRRMQAENIIRLAQEISLKRQIPVLIGGDFNFGMDKMELVVKDISSRGKNGLNQSAAESGHYPEDIWLPSMRNGSLWPLKHLISMNVVACKSSVVKEYGSDFFVASEALELKEPTLVDMGSATGKKAEVNEKCFIDDPKIIPNGTCYAPTKTTMSMKPRPPKHSGG